MLLKSVRVKQYKSVTDSGLVEFDCNVTCLVGKNESGKTAFLETLYRLNPLPMGHLETFDGLRDYPRRTYNRDRESVPGTTVIEATFTLEPDDISEVSSVFGKGVLAGTHLIICKNYENKQAWTRPINEQELIKHLVANAGVDQTKLHVIYNGVDLSVFHTGNRQAARSSLGLPQTVPVILYVGNFLPVKNPLLLIAAHAELLRTRGAHHLLVMIGEGPLLKRARGLAKKSGIEDRVLFAGRKQPGEVALFMQAANVLCVPSSNEGIPNVIRQALACGLPVVATKVGGVPEVLNQPFLGRMVEPNDQTALVQALTDILSEEPQTIRISQHAKQFSWGNTAEAYFRLLRAACHAN